MVGTSRNTKTQAPTILVGRQGINAKKGNQQEKRANGIIQITAPLGFQNRDEGFYR